MLIKSISALAISVVFAGSVLAGDRSKLNAMIAASDGVVFGNARVESWATNSPNLISGKIVVDNDPSTAITFEDLPRPYAARLVSGGSSILYRDSPQGRKLGKV